MYIPDESGINSLGGFAYQIKVFVSYMLSMEEGMQAEFETADDIAISKMTPDIIDDNEDKFRNLIVSPNGIKAIQVKRTSITEKVAKQVLLNWMLLEKSGKTITNYILFTDKSYKNSDIVFDVSAEVLYEEILNSKKSEKATITKVKKEYENDKYRFLNVYEMIKSKYTFVSVDSIDEEINEKCKVLFKKAGVNRITYCNRIQELLRHIVQQLGRGLRKAEGKEYVVIIDFIGNYTNNYMIPIALSGDRSYNKDSIRRYVSEGTRIIPGASTIHFDEISRKRIFQSIDSARTNDVKLLREFFEQLKYRLGRIPSILDFRKYGSIDVNKYFVKFDSYYAFLVKYYSEEYKVRLTPEEVSIIEFLSKKVTNMKRIHELALLQQLLKQRRRVFTYYENVLNVTYHKKLNLQTEESVVRNLTNEFPKEEERKKYKDCVLIRKSSEGYELEDKFEKMLNENLEFLKMVDELIQYGIENYQENYSDSYKDTDFQLYQKYTYEDVCRLLNWQRNMNAQNIGGYFYDATTKTLPVFINYDKAEDAIAYEDRFVTRENLIALSKHPRKVNSSDADHFFKRTEADKENKILLFVRKNKDDKETKEFYFLGEVFAQGEPIPIKMEKTGDDAFEINYKLDVPVREDIYEYIVSEA